MMPQPEQDQIFNAPLSEDALTELRDTARWTKILAIVGWIALAAMGLVFLMFLLTGSLAGLIAGADVSAQIISGFLASAIVLGTYWYPTWMLHRFSRQMRLAADRGDAVLLFRALRDLKRFFKFIALILLVFIFLYLIIVLVDAFLVFH